jgi:hypothetical protein
MKRHAVYGATSLVPLIEPVKATGSIAPFGGHRELVSTPIVTTGGAQNVFRSTPAAPFGATRITNSTQTRHDIRPTIGVQILNGDTPQGLGPARSEGHHWLEAAVMHGARHLREGRGIVSMLQP